MNEKVNPIVIKFPETNEEYTLEFSRESVKFAEERGFKWDSLPSITGIENLFWFAFRMHHRKLAKANTDKILKRIGGMSPKMIVRLRELWNLTYDGILTDDEEFEENVKNANVAIEM